MAPTPTAVASIVAGWPERAAADRRRGAAWVAGATRVALVLASLPAIVPLVLLYLLAIACAPRARPTPAGRLGRPRGRR